MPGRAAQQQPERLGDDIVGQAASFQVRRDAPGNSEKIVPGLPGERLARGRVSGEEADDEVRDPGTDTEPTRALRALCRSRKDLVETRVQVIGQLRATLELAFPGAIGLFAKPASGISLALLQRFPAAWRSPGRIGSGLRSARYTGGISAAVLHGRLAGVAPGLTGPDGEARGQITLAFVTLHGPDPGVGQGGVERGGEV